MKKLIILGIIIGLVAGVLTVYNKNTEKKAIETALNAIEVVFNAKVEYQKNSSRAIVTKYVENEEELYKLTKYALPKLSSIGDYEVIKLLSVRAYYDEDKEDFQYYDIEFKDIRKLQWDNIKNFDMFLINLNRLQ